MMGINSVYSKPISEIEFASAMNSVKNRFGVDENEWYIYLESEDYIYDQRLIEKGMEPKHSDTHRKFPKIIKNGQIDIDNIGDDFMLPDPIALIKEWQSSPNSWEKKVVSVMKTLGDFKNVIKILDIGSSNDCINPVSSGLTRPLEGREKIVSDIVQNLISRMSTIDTTDKNKSRQYQQEINTIVATYNSFHPVWSFVKLSKLNYWSKEIEVPFIRKGNRAINDINVNLRPSEDLKVSPTDKQFSQGYIPYLINKMVLGDIPNEIAAIVFNNTIVIDGLNLSEGQRLRAVLLSGNSRDSFDNRCIFKCKHFLENFFRENTIKEYNYTRYVKISIPK
ncbi:hypothetical protein [Acanthamoeba castellanii mimivirus]|uniref:Uncharacterized protein R257 n=6 Tax=Mimivirus TaxID=315393 RepID=YR257_MIMIV|nr:hypothetical protein MIMI_gp0281 [Acanthamoeba polyphaga mimivirus]Q5UPT7.1 RecName: Full=Uncharacterized protein R257 [Acanthamoeba polyphaga mimivirus]AHA45611.1 hypothetical protein HIRU_S705 [Hirudovirus strain Sangsue]ALR83838.1 hypothetical protein [Niemeyer virus]EJN40713.1 hypothetical protein lvs_R209 [Acanthamoeba polyphaga lentillevirus]BAV61353.1 hypothetical protein [Acanthamoeba castellanii mimivirus]AAV50529.1 unknown [Acanthamoeba polyphaga mimivirus]